MASTFQWIPISDFRGGQNSTDSPVDLAENQVALLRNGDTFRTHLFRKRGGAVGPAIGNVFSAPISSLIAHYPNNNPANAELWGVDSATPPNIGRMAAATTFSAPTLTDNPGTGAGPKVRGCSYNGKLFLAYDSAVDRFHCYDPNLSAARVRRVGLATPAAPTAADDAAGGTYAATLRYYRIRYRIKHGAIVDAQSEPSPSVAFTPAGNKTMAVVTKPATITESETHWILEGSADNVTFYELSEIVVGTTTYNDTATPSSYSAGTLSPLLGAYTVPTSFKYVIAAFNRIFGMGSWETSTPQQSRVWYSPAKSTRPILDTDDERIPNTLTVRNFFDLGEGIGGDGTGFAGPIYGSIFVFKQTQIRKVTPTGATSPAFDVVEISLTHGAIEQECIAVGDDAEGRPAIYFLDAQLGPMMTGALPPREIGQAIRSSWDSVNLAATSKVGQVFDYPAKGQVWFWWATGVSNDPNILAVYTKATGGWQVFDAGGKLRVARCAVLFARTPGTSMSGDNVPYIGYTSSNNKLLRGDTTDLDDDGTTYQGIVTTRAYAFNKGQPFRTFTPWLLAKKASGVTLTLTASADFGRETRTATVDLTGRSPAEDNATRVWRRCEGLELTDATFAQYSIGDAAAIANNWTVERLYVPVEALDADP